MANEQEVRQIIEKIDPSGKLTQSIQEELVMALSENDKRQPEKKTPIASIEFALKEELRHEPDWRKRAAIAAKIISINLD